jgi:predicted aldo/keto reductase-like oxidoreductase
MIRAALRWILDHEAVSTVIVGFKNINKWKITWPHSMFQASRQMKWSG